MKEFRKSMLFGASAHVVVFDQGGDKVVYLERHGNGHTPFKIPLRTSVRLRLSAEAQAALDEQLLSAASFYNFTATPPVEELERLVGQGASPNAKLEEIDEGSTYGMGQQKYIIPAVWLAADKAYTQTVEALLRLGADPDATRTPCGTTALMTAAGGHVEVEKVVALLRGGAAVDATSNFGGTALMEAAEQGHAECARLLLEAGADANLRGATRRASLNGEAEMKLTALEWAERRGCDEHLLQVAPLLQGR
eukprot:COSAG06_NODE_622_length_13723_cov_258.262184_13_plen_251_part_00